MSTSRTNPESTPSKRRRVTRSAPETIVPPTGELASTSLAKAPLAPGKERREAIAEERRALRRGDAVEAVQRKEKREERAARKGTKKAKGTKRKGSKPKVAKAPKPKSPRPTKTYKGAPKRPKRRTDPNSPEAIRARRERRLAKQSATRGSLS